MPAIVQTSNSLIANPGSAANVILTTGFQGPKGAPGKDAYKLALENGFVGTVAEWLDSLKGKDAYRIALANGFVGTFDEWVESWGGIKTSPGDAMKILTNDGLNNFWIDIMDARLGLVGVVEARINDVIDQKIESGEILSTESGTELIQTTIDSTIDALIQSGQIVTIGTVDTLVRESFELIPPNLDYGWIDPT